MSLLYNEKTIGKIIIIKQFTIEKRGAMGNSINRYSQEELMRLIMDELEGIVVTDSKGRYIYVNNRWSAVTGLTLNQVKSKYVRDIVQNSLVDHVLKTRKYLSGDALLINSVTGIKTHMYCSYTPLFKNNDLVGCFTYMIMKSEHMNEHIDLPSQRIKSLIDELCNYLNIYKRNSIGKYSLNNIIGKSPSILKMKEEIVLASRTMSTVLVEGETGTGKELVAHSIHNLSNRAHNQFVKVNCAAIPEELLESEFFGYEAGSFTGADKAGKQGKFEIANNGSLLLDEINQMPIKLQPKLLRVLQEREIEKIGSSNSIPIDTRIIAVSNSPLEDLVEEGLFRKDLYYRLNVIRIRIPPLRERKIDIPAIADNLLMRLNYQLKMNIPSITEEAKIKLCEYDWPGNVRELQNVIERAMNLAWCESLQWEHFKDYFEQQSEKKLTALISIQSIKDRAEKEILIKALKNSDGNKSKVSEMLGISRTSLYKKLKKYHIE